MKLRPMIFIEYIKTNLVYSAKIAIFDEDS